MTPIELQEQIDQINMLAEKGTITAERASEWKERIVAEYEATSLPKGPGKPVPVSELPGHLVGATIKIGKAFLKGAGATYEGLSKREGYLNEDGKENRNRKRDRNVIDLYNDLPPQYK